MNNTLNRNRPQISQFTNHLHLTIYQNSQALHNLSKYQALQYDNFMFPSVKVPIL